MQLKFQLLQRITIQGLQDCCKRSTFKKFFEYIFFKKMLKSLQKQGWWSLHYEKSLNAPVKSKCSGIFAISCPVLPMKKQSILSQSKLYPSIQTTYFALLILFSKILIFIVSLETFGSVEEFAENYHNSLASFHSSVDFFSNLCLKACHMEPLSLPVDGGLVVGKCLLRCISDHTISTSPLW